MDACIKVWMDGLMVGWTNTLISTTVYLLYVYECI